MQQWFGRRLCPCLGTVTLVGVGLLVMFGWEPIVEHRSAWLTPVDLWEIFRGAHYVGWGYLGGVYTYGTGVLSLPGLPVVLAPVAMLSGHLGLTESYSPFFLAHPSAALILQPVVLLLTSTVLFASDSLAERLQVPSARRRTLCIVVTVVAMPIAALWGHPEDALAMTFALYAMGAMVEGRWARCGWLLGFGIAFQPLVAAMLPLLIGAAPVGRRVALAFRSAAVPVVLLAIALIENPSGAYREVLQQPTVPQQNHPTPWLAFAPRVPSLVSNTIHSWSAVTINGHVVLHMTTRHGPPVFVVAGGLGRTIYFVGCLLLGLFVWRRPQLPVRIVWLAALVLAARCGFEAVMCPYYLAPPIILGLVMVARTSRRRFVVATTVALVISVYAYPHLNPWLWWLPILAGLILLMGLAYPADSSGSNTVVKNPTSSDRTAPTPVEPGHSVRESVLSG